MAETVWTHKEKGGRYRKLGKATPAGVFADRDDQDYVAYYCCATGAIYIRLLSDWLEKMQELNDEN